jgi:hypothetical protein
MDMTTCPLLNNDCLLSNCEWYIQSAEMCAIAIIAIQSIAKGRPFDDIEGREKGKRRGGNK